MYNVSDAYKVAMARPVQRGKLSGTIESKSGSWSVDYTNDNIGKGSFSLTNQCSGNDNVEIGTVYTAELSCVFMDLDIERYQWQDSIIRPTHSLRLGDGTYEPVPLGVFNVKQADWISSGVEIKAYDNMVKLDKSCSIKTMQGSIYTFLSMAAYACRIELAQTEEYIQSLPNGNIELTVFVDNDIETWRDLVAWCAQTTGTFAIMDRAGRLELRTYGTEPVDEINYDRRITGSKFSDFETRYTGMSIVNISEKSTTYYNVLPDDGLTYNLGSNPLLQTGFEDVLEQQRRAVLDALTVIEYVPFEVSMICPPAYDLGDIVVFKNGIADGDKISCITQYDWKYGNDYSIKGVGQNPELASARSKTDKNLTGIMKSGEENKIQYYSFTNASDIKIEDGETKTIINIRFQCTQPTTAIFHAEVLLQAETTVDDITYKDAIGKVLYYFNSELVIDYEPQQVWMDGRHMLHLLYYFNLQNTQINDFDVRLNMTGGSAFIKQMSIKAAIYGQNLYATDKFDGIIKITEDFSDMAPVLIPELNIFNTMAEELASEMYEEITDGCSDDFSGVVAVLEALTITSMTGETVEVTTE